MKTDANEFDLSGRIALVTGASRGIGFAIAAGLARVGAAVVMTGRKLDTIRAAAQQIHAQGVTAHARVCHQGETGAIEALFGELDQANLQPDIVFVNAATNPVYGPLLDVDLGAWQKILDVNLTGALLTTQLAARRMKVKGKGAIIFVASVAGLDPMPGIGAYSVSKAGLLGLARALAKELGPNGIRVNALAPGLIETKFSAALLQDEQTYTRFMAQVPLGRHGQPEDLVGAALFLASDASRYITGQVLVVDGGSRM